MESMEEDAVLTCVDNSTGKYKWLIYISMLSAALCYTLLLARWHGETNWLESFYIFPGYVQCCVNASSKSLQAWHFG
jgi:hypothetical protein